MTLMMIYRFKPNKAPSIRGWETYEGANQRNTLIVLSIRDDPRKFNIIRD